MVDDFVRHLLFVMLAHADEFALYAVCAQKLCGNARIFGADNVGFCRTASARRVISAKLPMGVATTYNVRFSILSAAFEGVFETWLYQVV